jgi:hypothetical protein
LQAERLGIGAAARAGVERVDGDDLVGAQGEVEDVGVLGDATRVDRFRDDRVTEVDLPAQDDLCRCLAVARRNPRTTAWDSGSLEASASPM